MNHFELNFFPYSSSSFDIECGFADDRSFFSLCYLFNRSLCFCLCLIDPSKSMNGFKSRLIPNKNNSQLSTKRRRKRERSTCVSVQSNRSIDHYGLVQHLCLDPFELVLNFGSLYILLYLFYVFLFSHHNDANHLF